MISGVRPSTLRSIWIAVDTLVSTAYLKVHIAEEIFKSLNVDHCIQRSPSVIRPQEIPATGAFIGTPASIRERVERR